MAVTNTNTVRLVLPGVHQDNYCDEWRRRKNEVFGYRVNAKLLRSRKKVSLMSVIDEHFSTPISLTTTNLGDNVRHVALYTRLSS